MAVEIKKYLCQFKCGHKAMGKLKDMERHEKTCWYNPQLKTCKSCRFEYYVKNTESHDELEGCPKEVWMERNCTAAMVLLEPDRFEKLLKERQPFQPQSQFHINPIVNCPYWQNKKQEVENEK